MTKDLNGKATHTVTPTPDPTTLTTDQLRREIASLRELLESRLKSMDTATELVKVGNDKVPCLIAEAVRRLRELHDEKFSSIQTQFKERDGRSERESRDNKVAVDAALQAAKEAVGEQNKSNVQANTKMETAFTKQIDQINTMIMAMSKALDDKVDDLKSRITTIESSLNTRQVVTSDKNDTKAWLIPLMAAIGLGLISSGLALAALFRG